MATPDEACEYSQKHAGRWVTVRFPVRPLDVFDASRRPDGTWRGRVVGSDSSPLSGGRVICEFPGTGANRRYRTATETTWASDYDLSICWCVDVSWLSLEEAPASAPVPATAAGRKQIPDWPHTCPRCGAPALILFSGVDCSQCGGAGSVYRSRS